MSAETRVMRERERRHELRRKLDGEGYLVVVEPGPEDLPSGLRDLRPYLIALRDDENVVIEIQSRETLSGARELTAMARAVERMEGWRFELVVTNPRESREGGQALRGLTEEEIQRRLREAEHLRHEQFSEAAYLLAWFTLEAALRIVLKQLEVRVERETPGYAIRRLYSLAVLSQDDRQILDKGSLFETI